MLNVTIQNDGKIKFQSECSNTKKMKFNVNLLLGVVQSMEIEEKANKDTDDITRAVKHSFKKGKRNCVCKIIKK